MKKRETTCRRRMKTVMVLFYGGFGLLLLAWAAVSGSLSPLPAVLLAVGLAAMVAASVLSFAVRCPHCGANLCRGMRLPGPLPGFCPHCGAKVE